LGFGQTYEDTWTSQPNATSAGRSNATAYAVTDKFTLKLRDAGEDSEYQPSIGRGGINAFMEGNKMNA
jgi:hypothetical protein